LPGQGFNLIERTGGVSRAGQSGIPALAEVGYAPSGQLVTSAGTRCDVGVLDGVLA